MPHAPEDKKKAISRLRRIRGQAEALERAVESGTECGQLLQQLAALRGAVNGIFAEILEGHMRETFDPAAHNDTRTQKELEGVISLLRSYIK